jgi:hypothetical protein
MSSRNDDRFRVRPGAPKSRQQKFVYKGLRMSARLVTVWHTPCTGPCGRPFYWTHCAARIEARRDQDTVVNLKQAGSR